MKVAIKGFIMEGSVRSFLLRSVRLSARFKRSCALLELGTFDLDSYDTIAAMSFGSCGFFLFLLIFQTAARSPAVWAETSLPSTSTTTTPSLRPVPTDHWPVFHDDLNRSSLLKAAEKSLIYLKRRAAEQPIYHTVDRDLTLDELISSVDEFIRVVKKSKTDQELNSRLRKSFDLYQSAGSKGDGIVIFSDYFAPVYPASLQATDKFKYPLYRWPSDLIVADLGRFDAKLEGQTVIGRANADRSLVPYFSRHDIDSGHVLAGKGLEIAWLASPFDRMDVHLEGSGILKLDDGRKVLARHTITNGLKFESVGAGLIQAGVVPKAAYSRVWLRQYLEENPDKADAALDHNPRYVFFEIVPLPSDGETYGRIQATEIASLTNGRSMAVDPNVFPLGSIAYYETTQAQLDEKKEKFIGTTPTSRFAFPQDTGGAIRGPGHVDLYIGSGPEADTIASHEWAKGTLYILLKKSAPAKS